MLIIQRLSPYSKEKFETLTFIGFILAGVFYAFGFMFFNQHTALLYGLFSGLIMFLFLKNMLMDNIMIIRLEGFLTFAVVLEFAFLLYDQVHLKDDLYFLPWAALLGGLVMVATSILIVFKKITIRKTFSKFFYVSVVFLFSTIYSYGLLSLINIFNARQFVIWERGKVEVPFLFVTFGGDCNDVIFENKEWGNRMMNLFFIKGEDDFPHQPKTAEVKVFKGNLGKDYMLKTYDEDEKKRCKANRITWTKLYILTTAHPLQWILGS